MTNCLRPTIALRPVLSKRQLLAESGPSGPLSYSPYVSRRQPLCSNDGFREGVLRNPKPEHQRPYLYTNVRVFEVPALVVIVTATAGDDPAMTGTTTVQEVWTGHLVGAACLSKRARICPSALKRLTPDITTT